MLSTGTKVRSIAVFSGEAVSGKSPSRCVCASISRDCRSLRIHSRFQRSGRFTSLVARSAQAEAGKLISKVEIPAFIPRVDLIDQLVRWAVIEIQENGMANVGCPCKVRTKIRILPRLLHCMSNNVNITEHRIVL